MTPSVNERTVLLFNLIVGAVPAEAAPSARQLPFREIAAILQRVKDAGLAVEIRSADEVQQEEEADAQAEVHLPQIGNPAVPVVALPAAEVAVLERPAGAPAGRANAIILQHIEIHPDDGTVSLFFQAGDAQGTNPAFLNPTTRGIRFARPRAGESNGYSAHLVIGSSRQNGVYRAALERMPSLGRNAIISFLNRLITLGVKMDEDRGRWLFIDPERKQRSYRPKMSSTLQMSRQLGQDLQENALTTIELIGDDVIDEFDEFDQVTPIRRRMELRVKSDRLGENAVNLLNGLLVKARNLRYTRMDIKLRRTATGQTSSARLNTAMMDAAEAVYARNEIINGFERELEQCWEAIHQPTVAKIKRLVQNNDLWN
ncbi:hypothetical protein [Azospirillum agricola]|uniref:hypothetical protein n=1 Tax=Azospirillum agricola TaxID=1720247 RepID=UPI000A0EEFEA|nr:hypothetical protein [Azospirillum agricola]SMH60493.1 hypothetical protein SAMN02982994_5528 [Azospirillum lipoferum]